ncbi:hypothetical protein LVJ94_05035 [Pendulispora rubella]|uniref:Uncharacterized protein n=1 Tax=Pendulispora rubella TaxID=2741070 RepID=A0ABZ2L6N9_9BACT
MPSDEPLLRELDAADVVYRIVGNATPELRIDAGDANVMRACIALRAFGATAQTIVDFSRAPEGATVWVDTGSGRVALRKETLPPPS